MDCWFSTPLTYKSQCMRMGEGGKGVGEEHRYCLIPGPKAVCSRVNEPTQLTHWEVCMNELREQETLPR